MEGLTTMKNRFSLFILLFCLLTTLFLLYPSAVSAVSVTLTPDSSYEKWLPGNSNTLSFTVTVSGLHGPKGFSAGSVSLTFENVSNWPGLCMNMNMPADYPDTETENDLRFYPKDQTELGSDGLKWVPAIWNSLVGEESTGKYEGVQKSVGVKFTSALNRDTFSFTITVRCEDYGAFGTLVATLIKNEDNKEQASDEKDIPKDENDDYRADAWDEVKRNPAADAEEGPTTGTGVEKNTKKGDGLTVFEEYRGFMIGGIHTRLNPLKKDIFIHSPYSVFLSEIVNGKTVYKGLKTSGIGYANALPNTFGKHEILENEVKNPDKDDKGYPIDRTVNFNSLGKPPGAQDADAQWWVISKKAIWVKKDSAAAHTGENGTVSGLYDPNNGTVIVYTTRIEVKANRDSLIEQKSIDLVLGHEIGHAVGLNHPWESNVNGKVHKIPTQDKTDNPNLDFRGDNNDGNNDNEGDDVDPLSDTARGWIGLYAFDNSTDAYLEVQRRVGFAKALQEADEKAKKKYEAARNNGQTIEQAKEVRDNFKKTAEYQNPLNLRNFYWDTNNRPYTLKNKPTYTSNLDPTNTEAYFTYPYGGSIMDYPLHITGGLYESIWPSKYHELHNWEYDLGAPQGNENPKWTERSGEENLENQLNQDTDTDTYAGTDTAPPDAPYGLSASYGNGQVRLSWTAGGGTTTDYEYRYRVKDAPTWGDWISALLSNPNVLSDTEVLILSLINGTAYEFQVRAMNGNQASTATESSEATPATVPSAPTSLIGDRYNGGVTLRWYPPDNDGGADVTDYEYRYSYTYGTYSSWTSIGGTNRYVSIGGLTNGRQYQFQVRAKNSAGYGAESLTIYKTPATIPSAPLNLTLSAGDGEVTLTWGTPYSNGGSVITDYQYSYRESSSDSWGAWTPAGSDLSETITGLTNGTEYEFRVRAKNRVGSGAWSGPFRATPQPPPVWSDIPDPYNLTVGDSFSLDLRSYVTGSPTITRNGGAIPAGLSLSNGVLSGTVTRVKTRSIQFTATNSAGSAQSEWVKIIVRAAQ
ncbi:hypothetical protein C6501_14945 [Candidatus Poribacteria bacterium]|nr:MAG: hypothetical protein C6501_14945 [Candidatus Poribacteria bacterium]